MRVPRMIAVALAGAAVLAPTAACSSDDPPPAGKPQAGAAEPSAAPTPTPEPTHPFTGLPGAARRPVLAVKIENTSAGKPQLGLRSADIVYVEQVEAGLTRLMAIFSSKIPAKIGPVRSARISDLHIVPQFGKPAFAYSGAQTKMLPIIAQASLFDVSDSRAPGAYFRQPGRVAPYNLFANTRQLLAKAPSASKAKDVGFTFGDAPEGGVPRKAYTVKYPAARFTFAWSQAAGKWLIWQDGEKDMAAEGGQLGAPTIVVQYTKTERSQFHDKNQSYTPLVHTTGEGNAIVLRDGQAFKARWSREKEEDGTVFTTPGGEPMNFAPGQVWVVLASRKPVIP
ncbi:hypothetical protein FHS43_006320 [Streptosporangium becharense]|uniref:DUF3048 domain-containing protein n=1 Tax=Streptosporangium becharense TaxID=1816182 RepID=A0A7W9MF63_9ACTN|nr:DUF3048 domain-containing protein [Streptosporangium becharense]MBB2915005.1 hypothetical protein [Streptosporangium becharense]MBB5818054.1 hypothetical protein [Streptosporangium becharense]